MPKMCGAGFADCHPSTRRLRGAASPLKDRHAMADEAPLVGIIMGSQSDWQTMRHAAELLDELEIPYESKIVSAHRTPERLYSYARSAAGRGLRIIIAG